MHLNSFTSYIKYFCNKHKLTESTFYAKYNASKLLDTYIQNNNLNVTEIYFKIKQEKKAVASFNLIYKLTKNLKLKDKELFINKFINIILNNTITFSNFYLVTKNYKTYNYKNLLEIIKKIELIVIIGNKYKTFSNFTEKKNYKFLFNVNYKNTIIPILLLKKEEEIITHAFYFKEDKQNCICNYNWLVTDALNRTNNNFGIITTIDGRLRIIKKTKKVTVNEDLYITILLSLI